MEIKINWSICRLCLQENSSSDMLYIFGENANTLGSGSQTLPKKILICTGVEINANEPAALPDKICKHCNNKLNIANKFRAVSQHSQKQLQKFLLTTSKVKNEALDLLKPLDEDPDAVETIADSYTIEIETDPSEPTRTEQMSEGDDEVIVEELESKDDIEFEYEKVTNEEDDTVVHDSEAVELIDDLNEQYSDENHEIAESQKSKLTECPEPIRKIPRKTRRSQRTTTKTPLYKIPKKTRQSQRKTTKTTQYGSQKHAAEDQNIRRIKVKSKRYWMNKLAMELQIYQGRRKLVPLDTSAEVHKELTKVRACNHRARKNMEKFLENEKKIRKKKD